MPSIEETKSWARALHDGQFDKAGYPYIDHVLRVYQNLLSRFPEAEDDTQHAALLHDTIEDCGVEAQDLRARGYSEATIQIVVAVTKVPGSGLTYAERIERLAQSGPMGAIQVKIADLMDNSDAARLSRLPKDVASSLWARYSKALDRLSLEL